MAKKLVGERVTLDVVGEVSAITLRPITKVSLRTKDDREALIRHASVQSQLQQRWAAARKGAVSLSNKEVHALAGLWYRDLISTHEDDPGDADNWEIFQEHLGEGLAYFDPDSDGTHSEPFNPKQGVRILSRQFNVDAFLAARGLSLDDATRTKLIEQVAVALVLGAETIKRRTRGDYGPDEIAKRFPPWQADKARMTPRQGSGPRLTEILDGWARESKPVQATLDLWRGYLKGFITYIGSDDAIAVQRSDVLKWKEHLIELGNSPKTINDSRSDSSVAPLPSRFATCCGPMLTFTRFTFPAHFTSIRSIMRLASRPRPNRQVFGFMKGRQRLRSTSKGCENSW
jgi:hypothetical protein